MQLNRFPKYENSTIPQFQVLHSIVLLFGQVSLNLVYPAEPEAKNSPEGEKATDITLSV